jgi:hypothetical protein
MVSWTLVKKNYREEDYHSELIDYLGQKIMILVNLNYHTYLHYWDVGMHVIYSSKSRELACTAGVVKSDSRKPRKEMRKIAVNWMNDFDLGRDVDQVLEQFYKDRIRLKD